MTENMILYHVYESDASVDDRRDMDDLLMILKHLIWRLRFRENQERYPTPKQVIVTIIIELEHLLKCKDKMGVRSYEIFNMISILRSEINWN